MYELALFAGGGGGLLATKWLLGWRTVCYVENDGYRVEVLRARIREGLLDDAPIWDDVRTFDGRAWRGWVDVVSAGFPCQRFSVAGWMEGEDDERNLWPDTIRVTREVRPGWCLLENVPGLLSGSHGYFGQILRELAESGYDAWWKVLSAAEVGAPHKRDRVWIVAVANADGCEVRLESGRGCWACGKGTSEVGDDGAEEFVADAEGEREGAGQQQGRGDGFVEGSEAVADADSAWELQSEGGKWSERGRAGNGSEIPYRAVERRAWAELAELAGGGEGKEVGRQDWWAVEPGLGRVADGVARRVDRLAAIGDGQVPAVVAVVWGLLQAGLGGS